MCVTYIIRLGHIEGLTSESSHLYISAVREVDRLLHGTEEEKGAEILNRAFFIVIVGLVFYNKISEETKAKFYCLLGRFLIPGILVSNWSTIEKTAATTIFTFPFSPSAFFVVPICVQLQCLYRKQALQGQSVHLTQDRFRHTGAAHGTDLPSSGPPKPWAKTQNP